MRQLIEEKGGTSTAEGEGFIKINPPPPQIDKMN